MLRQAQHYRLMVTVTMSLSKGRVMNKETSELNKSINPIYQNIQVFRSCVNIRSNADSNDVFPVDRDRMNFILIKQKHIKLTRFLSLDADVSNCAAPFRV